MPLKLIGIVCCVGCFLVCPRGSSRAADVEFFDGTVTKGEVSFRAGKLVVTTGKIDRDISLERLFEIRFAVFRGGAPGKTLDRVTLAGRCSVVGRLLPAMNFRRLTLERPDGSKLQVDGGQVRGIVFRELNAGVREGKTPAPPYVVMCTGKVIAGAPTWLTYLEIAVVTPAGQIRLRRDQVHRVCLRTGDGVAPTGGVCRVKTRLGDTLVGRLARLDSRVLEMRCPWGVIRLPVHLLATLSPVSERVVSLVSLKPIAVQETPFFGLVRHYQVNRNLFGAALRLRGRHFDLGLALHSRTRLVYRLDGRYARLVADLGMDTSLTDKGDGLFSVIVDGKSLRTVRVTGKARPVRLSIPLQGANRMELLWDFGTGGSSGDHLVIGNPRLIRGR